MSDNRGEKYTFLGYGVKKSAGLLIKKAVGLILFIKAPQKRTITGRLSAPKNRPAKPHKTDPCVLLDFFSGFQQRPLGTTKKDKLTITLFNGVTTLTICLY